MPKWIEKRKERICGKNPGLSESACWGIATQQAHAAGKTPKDYGTEEGRSTAKKKYRKEPAEYQKSASGLIAEIASHYSVVALAMRHV